MKIRLIAIATLGVLLFLIWWSVLGHETVAENNLQVHFLDVGQGDAIFIETPDGVQVLVDGGRDNKVLQELSKQMDFFDHNIDLVVGTHPDSDHIGGLVPVLERYEVAQILVTDNKGKSAAADEYTRLVSKEGAKIINARRGQVFQLGASTTLEVLWPETEVKDMESNTASIVLKLVYGDTSFLLTGDSPKRIEEYLVLAFGEHLQSTVLKAGHHGSHTSTAELFLDEVAPEYVVLSYGAGNSYGHPHVEVTDMLFNKHIKTLSTAKEGTITFYSDGVELWTD